MFPFLLHLALLGLLFVVMAGGGMLAMAGSYAALIDKGATRAGQLLDALCWLAAAIGILIFVLAAAHFVPLVIA